MNLEEQFKKRSVRQDRRVESYLDGFRMAIMPRISRIWHLAADIANTSGHDAIRAAQLWLWNELKLAVEPAAALPLAALHSKRYVPRADETVCLVICGANVDPASLN